MPGDKIDWHAMARQANVHARKALDSRPDLYGNEYWAKYHVIRDEHFARLVLEECVEIAKRRKDSAIACLIAADIIERMP